MSKVKIDKKTGEEILWESPCNCWSKERGRAQMGNLRLTGGRLRFNPIIGSRWPWEKPGRWI